MEPISIIAGLIALAAGSAGGFLIANKGGGTSIADFQEKADKKLSKAEEEAQQVQHEAKEKASKMKDRIKEDEARSLEQQKKRQQLIDSKDGQAQKKNSQVQELENHVKNVDREIETFKQKNIEAQKILTEKLIQKTGISREKAQDTIMQDLARDLELMREERLHKYEQYLEEEKARIAKDVLDSAIQRYSAPTSVEKRSLAVVVKHDEDKGKIIGPNAEHLILLQELTECDIIFNDAPKTIIISCLDLVKKHIARETIMKLIKHRNVTADVIREQIELVKKEMEKLLIKIGKDTVKKLELDARGPYSDDFYRIMGRLQFRSSYGQNIMKHSFEVGYFTLMLAGEIGADMETARIAGFFHDLGKAIDHEMNEPHDHLTKKIMEEAGSFSHEEVHAAWNHHDAIPHESAESKLVMAADAISAGRPGARQETLEKFLEHVRMIEGVANSYEGVKKTFAISAGRELRVLVEPQQLEDKHLHDLAKAIAGEIEEQKAYPGKVKINVIRRTKETQYARKAAKAGK
ncbi:MAG: Rnase Y domain-containing protein [Candidatus Gracilibacteria bacterium]